MFKVIICDDEKIARKTIKNAVDWNSFDFEVVEMLENGEQALEYIKSNPVDIVITDIKMPKIDGVTLSKIIHEEFPHIKVIIFSAYRDFEHAKSAIRYNVFDYLLKPISFSELNKTLENLKDVLVTQKIQSHFPAPNILMQRTDYLTEAFLTHKNLENLSLSLKKTNMTIDLTEALCAHIVITLENFDNIFKKNSQQKKSVLNDVFSNIIPAKNQNVYYAILTLYENTIEIFAVSSQISDLDALKKNIELFSEKTSEIIKEFLSTKITYEIKQLCKTIYDIDATKSQVYHKSNNSDKSEIIDEIIEYLHTHYMEDITLDNLSKKFYLYPTRVSMLFKKYTNQNYNDFLTDIRIKKAKEMLRETEMKTSAICEAIGYANDKYFSRIFKNCVGLSPTEYRNKYRQE